ncbi:MAG: pantoate--beta-alanine ligase [Nocardioides sp.]
MTRLASDRSELAAILSGAAGRTVLVPTMGALHDGHAALIRVARQYAGPEGRVVVSIFVNPLQFGEGEDLDRYPKSLDADLAVCAAQGADVVFAPAVEEMYPHGVRAGGAVTIAPGTLASVLEGESRPGHFVGVLTVVAKLFGLVRPEVAIFGEKDYQQLTLIRRMVADLAMGIEIVGAETLRDPDGLAMSSRNRFLSADQRTSALVLSRALRAAQDRAGYGLPSARWAAMSMLKSDPAVEGDYLAIRAEDLSELPDYPEPGTRARILIAARVGSTRLIDNTSLIF